MFGAVVVGSAGLISFPFEGINPHQVRATFPAFPSHQKIWRNPSKIAKMCGDQSSPQPDFFRLFCWRTHLWCQSPGSILTAIPAIPCFSSQGAFAYGPAHLGKCSLSQSLTEPSPGDLEELLDEAHRLYQKWHSMLAKGLEDYPTGAAAFYHACHFQEVSEPLARSREVQGDATHGLKYVKQNRWL